MIFYGRTFIQRGCLERGDLKGVPQRDFRPANLLFGVKNESDYAYQVLIPYFETWGENGGGETAGGILAGENVLGDFGGEISTVSHGSRYFKKIWVPGVQVHLQIFCPTLKLFLCILHLCLKYKLRIILKVTLLVLYNNNLSGLPFYQDYGIIIVQDDYLGLPF